MSDPHGSGEDQPPRRHRLVWHLEESLIAGGLASILAVTLATVALAAAGAVIALLISLAF